MSRSPFEGSINLREPNEPLQRAAQLLGSMLGGDA
jgi:hypothetical protein